MVYYRLVSLREDRTLTQTKFAKELNIAQNTYSQYENGKRDIPTEILKKLALYYGTSVDYLIELTDDKRSYTRKSAT